MLSEPLAVTLRVVRAFERLGLRYLIGGSLASSFHGVPRSVIHLESMFKVDVFLLTREPILQEEMARRELHALAPNSAERAFFASAEDTVLQKLDWYRKGWGISDRQWSDVLGVLRVQSDTLDRDYMNRWATAMGLTDLLERAYREVERR